MTAAPTGTDRGGFATLGIVALTALVVVGALVYAALNFDVATSDGDSVSSRDRARAVATAEQFALRMDTRDAADPDAYKEAVSALLTTKFKATFQKEFDQFDDLVGFPEGVKSTGQVLASGVATVDADSATVLVVHDSTLTSTEGSGKQHYRWTVSLDKVGGRWLVDDYTQVS